MTRVLVVDNDAAMTRTLSINLQARRYDVDTAGTGAAALKHADHPPAPISLHLKLPDIDGIHAIATLAESSTAPIIVTSARDGDGPHDHTDAMDAGAAAFLVRPFGMDELLREVDQVIGP